jgi:N-glycosidase YbiA
MAYVPSDLRFYSERGEYGELSNFAPYPISLRGKRWPTVEHYFQAQKFEDDAAREEVRRAKSPALAAEIGRDRRRQLRRDWDKARLGVMREAVEAKFRQHSELCELLLATGEARLVEHTENDDFWGDGGDGRGRNELGRILMAVRAMLRAEGEGAR